MIFLGLSPGFVGLAQANIQVPNLSNGSYPLTITVNGKTSLVATMSVTGTGNSGGVSGIPPGLPSGAKCVSGTVDSITFSLEKQGSRIADDVSIGSTKLCATCQLKPPIYGNFAQKLEAAQSDGATVDVCYDGYGTLNYLRLR